MTHRADRVARPRRIAALALLAVLALGGPMTACSRTDDPGKGDITAEIDAIAADLGVADDISVQGYRVERGIDADACPDADERWVASRSATVPGDLLTRDQVVDGLVARYEPLDARLRLFRDTTGADNVVLLVLDAERGYAVKANVSRDGRTSLHLRHSPCPLDRYDVAPSGPYEETDLPA